MGPDTKAHHDPPPFPIFPTPGSLQPPSGGFVVDDFVTVTHPSAEVLVAHAHFEDFSQDLPEVDPSKLSSEAWAPTFQSLEEFQFAELALQLAMEHLGKQHCLHSLQSSSYIF